MSASHRLPTLFIAHGGGPCFFVKPGEVFPIGMWDRMAAYLSAIGQEVGAPPKAIVVISGHWEEDVPTVYGPPSPSLLYDYYNFPASTYELKYPAAGDPELAEDIAELLKGAGIPCAFNTQRGFDHGVFIPLKLIYPDANIPIVQLSLQSGLEPAAHLAIGKALAPLREKGILIIGSGMSYHNMSTIRTTSASDDVFARQFDDWLSAAVTDKNPASRNGHLKNWKAAPGALAAHPRAEHLVPLFVVAGAAGEDVGQRNYQDTLAGKALSGFVFAAPTQD